MSNGLQVLENKNNTVSLIKEVFAKGATQQELMLFSEICVQRNLNPLFKQIYFMKIWDSTQNKEVMSPVVSIEGFRCIAERSGKYQGQTIPMFCGKEGIWKEIWPEDKPPFACKVGVHRVGFKDPVYSIAEWNSFAKYKKDGSLTQFWLKFKTLMLAKCAEAGALRKAFPEDLSGLYAQEEMEQSSIDDSINVVMPESKKNVVNNIVNIKPIQQPTDPNKFSNEQKKIIWKVILDLTKNFPLAYPKIDINLFQINLALHCEKEFFEKKISHISEIDFAKILREKINEYKEFYGEEDTKVETKEETQ